MQEAELKKILQELYALEPDLKLYERELLVLVSRMQNAKPDTKFDAAFATRLKAEFMQISPETETEIESKESKNLNSIFNSNNMNKKFYLALGSLAVISVAVVFFVKPQISHLINPQKDAQEINNKVAGAGDENQEAVRVLSAGAFGDLASLGTAVNSPSEKTSAMALSGGGGTFAGAEMSRVSLATMDTAQANSGIAVSAIAPDMKIMPPFYGFQYVYKGDTLNLTDESGQVYRRIKGSPTIAKNMAGLIGGFDFDGFSLSAFSDLKASNITLTEDKNLGLMIYFDFNEGTININENWEKWTTPERDACGGDSACWDRYRIKIGDVPADSDLISLADKFLAVHTVNLEHYGAALVDNYWRDDYTRTTDQANFYIPEYATVIYPLLVDGKAVRDQSGNYAGLRVSINLNKKVASGLSGLVPYRYESSKYDLETSSDKLIKLAENGGWNGNYYYQSPENTQTIELGTPEISYTQIYRYVDNRNEELLVPALIFPIVKIPEGVNYYGQKYVVVPLVKEMMNELGNQPGIMYKTIQAGGAVSGSVGGSQGMMESVPAIAPAPDLMR